MGKHLTKFQEGYLKGLLDAEKPWHVIKDIYKKNYKRNLSSSVLDRVNKLSIQSKKIKREMRGRKRKTTARTDRMIKRVIKQNRMKSWEGIAENLQESHNVDVKTDTVRSRAEEIGIKNYKALKKPKLTPRKVKKRLLFAKSKKKWSLRRWTKVVFVDEKKLTLFHTSDDQVARNVKRERGEELLPECTVPTVKHGGGNIKFWASFSYEGPGELEIIEEKMTGKVYKKVLDENCGNRSTT